MRTAPVFNHAGVTVPDLDAGIAFYQGMLGLNLLGGPLEIGREDEPFGEVLGDIFGPRWARLRVAFLSTREGTGLELFEFVRPATVRPDEVEYWRTGPFHLCLTWPDVSELADRIVAGGGKQRSKVWTLFPDCDVVYCEDPFGTLIEVSSRSFERTWANRDGGAA
ncbi:hypothetical protein FPZ12_024355 [Amycolatopsis acidicola]|uniref:VOC domain-containing protein n=1 Tax=Amycolatopsis acidicola TaxID=2596893 RepID=A0A5N0V0P9_9PSEU|nr:VOC family protein [Amycolatopsis acidicola]KAA9157775.1 hypothetical protein FPZ12_024355 [Amycolatopsis acidicola]